MTSNIDSQYQLIELGSACLLVEDKPLIELHELVIVEFSVIENEYLGWIVVNRNHYSAYVSRETMRNEGRSMKLQLRKPEDKVRKCFT